mmetsp:Transcript_20076/g.57622  ORF Transcript_20076/g.57622 Transcript_20076/m.57622 type:complete len:219 (+) Transcript_20076:886-1542(+)
MEVGSTYCQTTSPSPRPGTAGILHGNTNITAIVSGSDGQFAYVQRTGHIESVEFAQRPGSRAGAVRHLDTKDVLADLFERTGYDGIDSGSRGDIDRALSFIVTSAATATAGRPNTLQPTRQRPTSAGRLELSRHGQISDGDMIIGIQHTEIRCEGFSNMNHTERVGKGAAGTHDGMRSETSRIGLAQLRCLEAHHLESWRCGRQGLIGRGRGGYRRGG